MRFSILTLNLAPLPKRAASSAFEPLSRFVAEHNVSCVCLQNVEQRTNSPLVDELGPAREDNSVALVAGQLARLGLKYSFVWSPAAIGGAGHDRGAAVLTQLPIVGSAPAGDDGRVSGPDSHQLVAARLGVSPEVNIDVYSVQFSGNEETRADEVDGLLQFVDDSVAIFSPEPQLVPRRRGRPPRVAALGKRANAVRMVFLAGCFADATDLVASGRFRAAGFGEVSRGVPPRRGSASGPSRTDAVYLRPGIRATDAGRVLLDGFIPGDGGGIFLAFEI